MYKFFRFLCRIVCKIFVWVKIENTEVIPKTGPVIFAANHESMFDVVSVTLKSGRKIHWMAKESVFKFKPIGALLKYCGGYPVKRNSHDTGAVGKTFELLGSGEAVGIFIQGTRSKGKGRQVKARHGAVKFAERCGCPIVPVTIVGKAGIFRRVKVIYGEPIHVPKGDYNNEEYKKMAQQLLDDIYDKVEEEMKHGNYKS